MKISFLRLSGAWLTWICFLLNVTQNFYFETYQKLHFVIYIFLLCEFNYNFIWWQSFKKKSQVWEGELRTVFQLLVTRSFSNDLFAEWNHHKSDIRILNLQKTMIDKVIARQVLIYVYVKLYWEKRLMEIRFVVSCAFNVTVSS